jgi:hypothetical protein
MYDGVARQKTEVAMIKTENTRIGIQSVDGKETIGPFEGFLYTDQWIGGANFARSVEVTPGQHELQISYRYDRSVSNPKYWLPAMSGHSYTIKYKVLGYRISIWFEDDETGAHVGYGENGNEP